MSEFSLKDARLISKVSIPQKKSNVKYYPKGTVFICKGLQVDNLDQYNSSDKNWQMGADYGFRLVTEKGKGEIHVNSTSLYLLFDPVDEDGNIISLE